MIATSSKMLFDSGHMYSSPTIFFSVLSLFEVNKILKNLISYSQGFTVFEATPLDMSSAR